MKTLKKLSCLFLMTVIVAVSIFSLISTPKYAEATGLVPLYSFTRNDSGAHYFTALESERSTIQSTNFWRADGVVGYVYDYQVNNSSPLYRFYNYTNGDYTYVTTEIERSNLLSQNSAWWRYEGVVGYISTYQYNNLLPLYRFTSSFDVNKHIYTFLESERLNLLSNRYVWIDGGVVGYISANNNYSYNNYYGYNNNYNYGYSNLNVTCSPNIVTAGLNTVVYWSAYATGGNGSYTYSWTGSDGLSGTQSLTNQSYNMPGVKTGNVSVYSGGLFTTVACNNSVTVSGSYNNNYYNSYNANYYNNGYNYGNYGVLYGTCVANKYNINTGEAVTWTALATGGSTGAYTYNWSGDENLLGYSSTINKNYWTLGNKKAFVTITSSGQSITRECINSVNVASIPVTVIVKEKVTETVPQTVVEKPTGNISVSCRPSAQVVNVNDSVIWVANVSGGNGSYVYTWEGSDGLNGADNVVTKSYFSTGNKVAVLTINSAGKTSSAICGNLQVVAAGVATSTGLSASALFGSWTGVIIFLLVIVALALAAYVVYFLWRRKQY